MLYIYVAKCESTSEAVNQFTSLMTTKRPQFSAPHARSIVENHVIAIFQHFYLYHHVMTEVQGVGVSNTLVSCHTPTRHPLLKEGG